jgi:DNA primase
METISEFKLGYAPADRYWLSKFLLKKGYSREFLASSMLFSSRDPNFSFFSHRLMFPIMDRQGRTVAFGGRLLSGEGPKYINSAESEFYKKKQTLFALHQALGEIRRTKEVYIAEGYMDAIALYQAGVMNVTAPLGTSLTDEQAKLLRRWAERVYLVFDTDRAGREAVVRAILTCRRNGLACAVVSPEAEDFKDPADILQKSGAEALQNQLKYFILDCEYLMYHSKSLFDINNAEGKTKAVKFMFPYLETLDSEVARELAVEQIADFFRIEPSAIRGDFDKNKGKDGNRAYNRTPAASVPPAKPVSMTGELNLLLAVMVNYHYYPEFRTELLIRDIEDSSAKELFLALEECYVYDESGMDALLARISSPELRRFLIKHTGFDAGSKEFSTKGAKIISDGIKKVKHKRLERRRKDIITELSYAARNKSTEMDEEGIWNELIAEKMHLDAQLHGSVPSAAL